MDDVAVEEVAVAARRAHPGTRGARRVEGRAAAPGFPVPSGRRGAPAGFPALPGGGRGASRGARRRGGSRARRHGLEALRILAGGAAASAPTWTRRGCRWRPGSPGPPSRSPRVATSARRSCCGPPPEATCSAAWCSSPCRRGGARDAARRRGRRGRVRDERGRDAGRAPGARLPSPGALGWGAAASRADGEPGGGEAGARGGGDSGVSDWQPSD